jgi:hypothetical protein
MSTLTTLLLCDALDEVIKGGAGSGPQQGGGGGNWITLSNGQKDKYWSKGGCC